MGGQFFSVAEGNGSYYGSYYCEIKSDHRHRLVAFDGLGLKEKKLVKMMRFLQSWSGYSPQQIQIVELI